ncbi:hypothetical protein F4818DRAFT_453017 [Hypoxylon cercidicola]|nr:hypothetical protein F4818DRAFT_453017 [Hypoxylon cercidicola]
MSSSKDSAAPSSEDSAGSSSQNPTSSSQLYRGFPPELKLKVWKELSMPRGVHHFDLQADITRGVHRQDLIVLPTTKYPDNSAWRVRNQAKWVDPYSWDVLSKNLEAKAKTRQFWPRPHNIVGSAQKMRSNEKMAIVDLENDLVQFNFIGLAMQTRWFPLQPWQEFHGLTRVAMEFRMITRSWARSPFACPCRGTTHWNMALCPEMLNTFFSYFRDLKSFYFVVKIHRTNIKPARPLLADRPRRTVAKRSQEPLSATNPQKAHVQRYMSEFREIQEREGLDFFEDKKYKYYEVREEDTRDKFKQDKVWKILGKVREVYKERMRYDARSTKKVALKVLVISDV